MLVVSLEELGAGSISKSEVTQVVCSRSVFPIEKLKVRQREEV
jgi:hypothetical protein